MICLHLFANRYNCIPYYIRPLRFWLLVVPWWLVVFLPGAGVPPWWLPSVEWFSVVAGGVLPGGWYAPWCLVVFLPGGCHRWSGSRWWLVVSSLVLVVLPGVWWCSSLVADIGAS